MIAIAGENRVIRVLDRYVHHFFVNICIIFNYFLSHRQGKVMLEIPSKHAPKIDDLAWDKDNDSLAILTVSFDNPSFGGV